MDVAFQGSMEDHIEIQLAEDWTWQRRQKFPLKRWPRAHAELTGFQIWAVFGREWRPWIDDGPAHLPVPIISALGQWSPLKNHSCYQSPSLLYINSPSSVSLFSPSIFVSPQDCVSEREKLCNTLTQSRSLHPSSFIFLHLCLPYTLFLYRFFSLSLSLPPSAAVD